MLFCFLKHVFNTSEQVYVVMMLFVYHWDQMLDLFHLALNYFICLWFKRKKKKRRKRCVCSVYERVSMIILKYLSCSLCVALPECKEMNV